MGDSDLADIAHHAAGAGDDERLVDAAREACPGVPRRRLDRTRRSSSPSSDSPSSRTIPRCWRARPAPRGSPGCFPTPRAHSRQRLEVARRSGDPEAESAALRLDVRLDLGDRRHRRAASGRRRRWPPSWTARPGGRSAAGRWRSSPSRTCSAIEPPGDRLGRSCPCRGRPPGWPCRRCGPRQRPCREGLGSRPWRPLGSTRAPSCSSSPPTWARTSATTSSSPGRCTTSCAPTRGRATQPVARRQLDRMRAAAERVGFDSMAGAAHAQGLADLARVGGRPRRGPRRPRRRPAHRPRLPPHQPRLAGSTSTRRGLLLEAGEPRARRGGRRDAGGHSDQEALLVQRPCRAHRCPPRRRRRRP